ncbi:MAG TPA: hypothetical protein VK738_19710 [Terriglobales bacterium]|jgi:hypothetical protein|nr:hypothetical protein [Terriglobales bacterium]
MASAAPDLTPPPPEIAKPLRLLMKISAWSIGIAIVVGGTTWLVWSHNQQQQKNYGEEASFTTAPGVTVAVYPWSGSLPSTEIQDFDVSRDGNIVVRTGNALYDPSNGEKLADDVQSFTFVKGALAVQTTEGHLAFWADDTLHDVGPLPVPVSRILPSEDEEQLLLTSNGESSLYSLVPEEGTLEPLLGPTEGVETAAGSPQRHFFAVDSSLFLQAGAARPLMLLDLPEANDRIVGLATQGDDTFFASQNMVYQLRGGVAFPLVIGLGGTLRMAPDGLLVLDQKTGHLYRISWAKNQA